MVSGNNHTQGLALAAQAQYDWAKILAPKILLVLKQLLFLMWEQDWNFDSWTVSHFRRDCSHWHFCYLSINVETGFPACVLYICYLNYICVVEFNWTELFFYTGIALVSTLKVSLPYNRKQVKFNLSCVCQTERNWFFSHWIGNILPPPPGLNSGS